MTVGFTGVVWFPRGATWNSTALNAGVGPVGFSAANVAWTAVSGGLTDASVTLARVLATLGAGWEGVAADAALSRLAPFRGWVDESAALAAETSAKAAAGAAAHTVARAVMPSAAEIAAVKASKVAAHAVGGSLAGAGAVAEAADRALDVRAALTMEAYESASAFVVTPERFTLPPLLVSGPGAEPSGHPQATPAPVAPVEFAVAPAQTTGGAVSALVHDPAVTAAASHAGGLAGSGAAVAGAAVAGAAAPWSSAGAAGGTLPAALSPGGEHAHGRGTAAAHGSSGRSGSGGARVGVSAGRTGTGPTPVAGAAGAARVAVPDGAARVAVPDGGASASPTAGAPSPVGRLASDGGSGVVDGQTRIDPAAGVRSTPTGAPAVRGGDDGEHRAAGYLRSFEHFEDGRVVIPAVIGAEPLDG